MTVHEASAAQQRFWFLEQLERDAGTGQTLVVCLQLNGAVDVDRLRDALSAVLVRHEVTRSAYRWQGDRLVANVLPIETIQIAESGSRVEPSWEQDDAIRQAQELASLPFDVAAGPLIRALVGANGPRQAYLILAVHHMVWDAWSFGNLVRELSLAYEGGAESLPDLPAQYWDYIAHQRLRSEGDRGERDVDYWGRQLADLDDLPPLVREPAAGEVATEIQDLRLAFGAELKAEVVAFSRAHGVTPFSVFAAGLQILLYRIGLGEQSRIGVPLADRPEPHFEKLLGCFLNTVVLCGSTGGADTFEQRVLAARDRTLEALHHGGLPFEVMASRVLPGRQLLTAPLYQALLVFQNTPQKRFEVAGVEGKALRVPRSRGRVDPTFTVWFERPDLDVDLEWNGLLAVSARRLLEGWRALLNAGIRDPGRCVDELPLGVASTAAVIGHGHAPDADAEPVRTVPDLVRERARRAPEAPAVIEADEELTLADVVGLAGEVADRLRSAGVVPGTTVGLAARRSAQTLISALGILEAGGACLPLDPDYPPERLRFMLEDSGAPILLCEGEVGDIGRGRTCLSVDGRGDGRIEPGGRRLPDGVAWVLYTSGSTGVPKGVLIGHAMVIARIRREPIPWADGERCCHKTSLNFIDSIWEMFAPLAHGLATVVADVDATRDARLFARLVQRHGVTRVVLVPSLLDVLLGLGPGDLARLASVRYWISSGEPLPAPLAERFHDLLPGATLVNLYGTSECWDATWHVVPDTVRAGDAVPIGKSLADVRVSVLDDGLNPVPPGVPGELVVGGACVAQGYLNRPDATLAKFVPAGPSTGGVLYRTGDVVRRREDGEIELLGRRDLQIKLRGFRIELEEVERHLRSIAAVAAAAAAAERDELGAVKRLEAYVVVEPGHDLDPAGLRRALGEQLPAHCVPSAFVAVEALPLTPNGKLDRAALEGLAARERPEAEAEGDAPATTEPRTDPEWALARIWSEVLEVETVGVTDDFFELGGHSLLAVQVVARVQEELGVEIPLRDFYDRPTVEALSELIVPVAER